MSLTITGVPAAGATDAPVPSPLTELAVADFVAMLQNSPMSGMPQLANPAALAGEVFNHLRGFIDRAQHYENLKLTPLRPADDGNIQLASADGGRLAALTGGPARDSSVLADPAPAGAASASTSQPVQGMTLADLQRVLDSCLAMLNFSLEATVVGGGVAQGVHSVNTLLRAQ